MGEQLPGITIPYAALAVFVPLFVLVFGLMWKLSTRVETLLYRVNELEHWKREREREDE